MGLRLTLLTLTFLLTVLQSSAQHRGRGHKKRTEQAARLPDSVSTSEEEIKPFATDTIVPSSGSDAAVVVDSAAVTTNADTSTSEPAETEEAPPVLRSIPDSAVRSWKNSHDFDYANDPSLWKRKKQEGDNFLWKFFNSKAWQYIVYILLAGILLYALYKIIAENNLRFFYRKPVRLKETILEEADLPEEDLDQLLKKAMEGKEYRLATRYLYLKTLRHLDTRGMIRWHSQATNAEYVHQMNAGALGERFRWLTSAYERVWYGKFPLDEHQFSRLSQYFQDFYQAVDHPQRA